MSGRSFRLSWILCICLTAICSVPSFGQRFTVKLSGTVTDLFSGEPVKSAMVRVLKDGENVAQQVTKRDGAYHFDLDRGWRYTVWFSKDGAVTKHVVIDTREVPAYPDVPFYDMTLQITLFPWIANFDLSAFEQPIGEAAYLERVHNMSWDVPYTELNRPLFSKLMNEYRKTFHGYYERTGKDTKDVIE